MEEKYLIVCEKPYHRKHIENFLLKNNLNHDVFHFDTIASIIKKKSKLLGNVVPSLDGDFYVVEGSVSNVRLYPLVLSNTGLSTDDYFISGNNRENRIFSEIYDAVLFACDPDMESLLSAFEYCQRNNIDLKNACFVPTPNITNEYLENIMDKSNWYPLVNSYSFVGFLF